MPHVQVSRHSCRWRCSDSLSENVVGLLNAGLVHRSQGGASVGIMCQKIASFRIFLVNQVEFNWSKQRCGCWWQNMVTTASALTVGLPEGPLGKPVPFFRSSVSSRGAFATMLEPMDWMMQQ